MAEKVYSNDGMIQEFNYHTHTYRCGHAKGTDEDYIQAAIKAGYKILGFSDHGPYKQIPSPGLRMEWHQLDDYVESLTTLKEKYEDQIEIHIGLETEYYSEYHEEKLEMLEKVEYLILGQHTALPTGEGTFFRFNTSDQLMKYAEDVCKGLETGLFTYLAHPDVYVYHQDSFDKTCKKVARMIMEKAAETDTPVEVNVHGVQRGRHSFPNGTMQYWYPHKDFWKIAAEYPIRCIYGIDAHDPRELLDLKAVEDAKAELEDLGLTFINEPLAIRR
ncbi:MAG: histidinol-phosphatase [Erysipelotrichaceae bacterium]|nr:histidinol-phosphatase [Erysipelotrichaceae bacterium]